MKTEDIIESATRDELRAAIYALAKTNPALPILDQAAEAISDLQYYLATQDALRLIRTSGARGLTSRELMQASRKFDSLDAESRDDILHELQARGKVESIESRGLSGRGRPRVAWVAVDREAAR